MKVVIGTIFIIAVFTLHYFEQRTNLAELGYLKYFLISVIAIYSIIRGFRGISKKADKN